MDSRLQELTPVVWRAYAKGGHVEDPAVKGDVLEFQNLWYMSVPGDYIPYYDYLGKDFQTWMDEVVK